MEDAQRLHHTLAKIAKKQKIKSLLFMGTASQSMVSRMYDIIVEETGWDILKVRRTTTRP
jgi:ABC-type Zn uptake system ZnuABC Zn-binding protein ZnuA